MILVTGGTGLVGSHLLYQLALKNDSLLAIHRKSSDFTIVKDVFKHYTKNADALFAKITWKEADISDISSLQEVFKTNFKYVYHCAAMISFDAKDYYKLRTVNIKGTANVVNLSLEINAEKFCFVSSIATIDEHSGKKYITEENEWNPEVKHHGYAITKYGAEMEVWRASQEGLNVVIINPGVILGTGSWDTGSGKLFSAVANGLTYYTEGVTGFVSVEDVVKSMISLMYSTIENERFILVAENRSFKEVLFQIADAFNTKRPSVKVNKFVSEAAWRLDWFKSLFGAERKLTKHMARSSHRVSHYGSDKIHNALDFNFEPIKETIEGVCESYKKH